MPPIDAVMAPDPVPVADPVMDPVTGPPPLPQGAPPGAARFPAGARMLFGIGAQKAGTSWLHALLRRSAEVHAPPSKELHYFDVMAGRADEALRLRVEQARVLAGRLSACPGPANRAALRQLRETAELLEIYTGAPGAPGPYLDYLLKGWAGQRIVADITPAYAILDTPHFAEMAAIGRARFLFVLRDPVARIWSQVRMAVAARGGSEPGARASACRDRAIHLLESQRLPGLGRSDYARTLAALEAAVPRARIHCCFHEDLVAPERSAATVAALCRFLGIPRLEPDPHRPVNRGAALPLPPDLEARLRAALAPQYDAMRARFGPALPAEWRD